MPHLRILDLPGRASFDIDISEGGIVGRDPNSRYPIEHPTVSRQHAQIHKNGAQLVLVDLNSANGTKVNGKKISAPTSLKESDLVEFGQINAEYFIANARTQLSPIKASGKAVVLTETVEAQPKIPLEKLEQLLAGLFGLLSKPRLPQQRAELIGAMFCNLLPGLTQAALLDPCGKLIGGIKGGRFFAPDFYGVLSGAVAVSDGVVALAAVELSKMAKELRLESAPEAIVCLKLESNTFKNGALYLESNKPFFLGEAVDTLKLAARLLGPLIDRAPEDAQFLITNDDLRLAQRIQKRLLVPATIKIPGLQVAMQYVPHYVIGGDFYDVRMVKKNEWAFILGDVSGKGASASLYMAQILAASRLLLPNSEGPAAFLNALNSYMTEVLEPGVFATTAAVFIQPDKGQCRLALAGHNPPLLRTHSGRVIDLGFDPGTPIGAQAKLECKDQRILLGKGDAIVLTSDGVEEAENEKAELFGNDRRNTALERMPGASSIAIALRESVFSFTGEPRSSDDLTILVIERE